MLHERFVSELITAQAIMQTRTGKMLEKKGTRQFTACMSLILYGYVDGRLRICVVNVTCANDGGVSQLAASSDTN